MCEEPSRELDARNFDDLRYGRALMVSAVLCFLMKTGAGVADDGRGTSGSSKDEMAVWWRPGQDNRPADPNR